MSQPHPPFTRRYAWGVVAMLWFICFFNYADRQAIFSIFKVLEAEYGFNKQELGMIGAAFTVIYAVTAPFAGSIADRYSRKVVILAGLYVWSVITGMTALCSKLWHFILVRGSEGLGETFYFPASMSLVSDYHARSTRSRAMSLHQTSVYAGTVGGGALAGWMAMEYGWRTPFYFLAGAGIVLGLVLAAFIREPARNAAELIEQGEDPALGHTPGAAAENIPYSEFLKELLKTPTALLLIAGFFGANFVALLFLTWTPMFLGDKFKLSLAAAGLTGTFFIQAGSFLGAFLGGIWADKIRQTKPGGRILVQSFGTLLGAPFIFLLGFTQDFNVLLVAMTLFGLFKGIYDANIWASLYDVVPVSRRAAAVGIMNMVGWTGGAIGAYTLGLLVEQKVFTMGQGLSSAAVIYLGATVILVTAALVFAPRDVARVEQVA